MDQEIRYAVANHLDYWAFDWYPEGLGYTQGNLSRAFDDYMASSLKYEMKFSFVIQSYWAYYIVSSETSGGDQWYGNTSLPSLTTTGVATVNSGVYFSSNAWHSYGSSGNCYVPLNFIY